MKALHSRGTVVRRRKRKPARRRGKGTLPAIAVAALALLLSSAPSGATPWDELPRLCDEAAARASATSGVPLSVLRAIALTETGRTRQGAFRPWPWTVNMEGAGKWFDSFAEARAYVAQHHARGARSYDVGCFQINYRWHGQHFASLDQMFDPDANAAYAARFLSELYAELGDWSRAAGAYHSRTPHFAGKYRTRFDRIRGRLIAASGGAEPEVTIARTKPGPAPGAMPGPHVATAPAQPLKVRDNRFPLLIATGSDRGLASLVPGEIAVTGRLIGDETRVIIE